MFRRCVTVVCLAVSLAVAGVVAQPAAADSSTAAQTYAPPRCC